MTLGNNYYKLLNKVVHMDLKCRKLDCKYNDNYKCEAKEIKVTQEIDCGTYEKCEHLEKEQMQDASRNMFEKEPKVSAYRHNKKVEILCEASCLFNKSKDCVANGICINDCKSIPTCITYIKK